VLYTVWPGVDRGSICLSWIASSDCHSFALSLSAFSRGKAALMPAAGRLHCIVCDRNLETLALVHSLCRWSAECGRLFVVYCRICGLNLALRRPPVSWVLNSLIRRWRKYTFGQTKQIQVAIINGSSLNRLGGQRFTSSSQAMKPWVYRVRTDAKYAILFLYI
jgi:hypothetical protein